MADVAKIAIKERTIDKELVKYVRFHTGIQLGAEVLTSVDGAKHKAQMELHRAGLYIIYPQKQGANIVQRHMIVPYAAIAFMELE